MSTERTPVARDLMTDVFAFPHIPYWFTLRQAVGILKNSLLKEEGTVAPPVVLVFDEKYNLVGMLTLPDLLAGMGELFGVPAPGGPTEGDWSSRPVSSCMKRLTAFVEPGAQLAETAAKLVGSGAPLIPVLEEGRKLVGVVRPREVFREYAGRI